MWGCTQNIWSGDETSIYSLSVSKCEGAHKTFGLEMKLVFIHFQYQSVEVHTFGLEMKLVFDHFQYQSVRVHTKHLVWR